jgi:hypothetical protein
MRGMMVLFIPNLDPSERPVEEAAGGIFEGKWSSRQITLGQSEKGRGIIEFLYDFPSNLLSERSVSYALEVSRA